MYPEAHGNEARRHPNFTQDRGDEEDDRRNDH